MPALSEFSNALEASIAVVRNRFLARLESQVAQLDDLMWQIEDDPSNDAAIEAATQIAHKMVGVAPTVGFDDVGELAKHAESALHRFRDRRTDRTLNRVSQTIESLTARLDEIQTATHSAMAG